MQHKYKVDQISSALADDFLSRHHYLSQQGNGFLSKASYGLFTESTGGGYGKFVGVIVFSGISVVETIIGAFDGFDRTSSQEGFWELARLAMDDENKERNLTSWFVSRAIKHLKKDYYVRAIISYADSRYHHGYIYQATNFGYYGMTAPKTDFFQTDENGNEKQVWRGKVKDIDGVWKPRARKYRYMIVFDKSLKVKWEKEPYPKGDNDEYQLSVPKQYQMNIFDL